MKQAAYGELVNVSQPVISRYVRAWVIFKSGSVESISEALDQARGKAVARSDNEMVSDLVAKGLLPKLAAWLRQYPDSNEVPQGSDPAVLRAEVRKLGEAAQLAGAVEAKGGLS